MTLFDFSKQIAALRQVKKYSETLFYFKEHKTAFSIDLIATNEYIVADILTCLRHTSQFEAGFKFIYIYGITIDAQQKERVLSAYGWLLWTKYKAENNDSNSSEIENSFFDDDEENALSIDASCDKNELIEKIELLIPLLTQFNSNFASTLISNLFTIVLKTEKKKPAPNWNMVNNFCNKIDKNSLSKKCSTIKVEKQGQWKDMELASDFENWYAYKSNALMKLEEWHECFDIATEALKIMNVFHYSNDVWFSRRIALCSKYLGNIEDAIKAFEILLTKKREWFIQKELAELYLEKDEIELAFTMAIDAANNFGALEYKIDLIFLLGCILKKQGSMNLAMKHFLLSKLIRQEEGWEIPKKVVDELTQLSASEKSSSLNLTELKGELQKYWKSFASIPNGKRIPILEKNEIFGGEIIKIIHNNERGKDGFIKTVTKNYYFTISPDIYLFSKISIGVKVLFKIVPAINKEKKEYAKILKVV